MFATSPNRSASTLLYDEARSGRIAYATISWRLRARSISNTWCDREIPTRSSFGLSSLPVSERPAWFHPTLSHGTPPICRTTGSSSTAFSIATMSASASGRRSLLWPTQRCPSAVAAGPATTSLHRPWVRFGYGEYQSSSTVVAKNSSGSTPAPSAQPSSSSISHGSDGAVASR